MVVPDDAKNRILLKATNIDEAIRKAEKHYKCEKKSLRVYTIKPPVSLLWGTIRKPGVLAISEEEAASIRGYGRSMEVDKSKDRVAEDILLCNESQ